jgi:hypothetical protein
MKEGLPKKPEFSTDYVRHSRASYGTYAKISQSENPQQAFDKNDQVTPDLTEAGVELAKQEAEKYFAELDPKEVKIFFVSSNEARTVETANIYRAVAKEMGFEVIKPEHSRSQISEEIADGEIRVIENLSINSENIMIDGIFSPAFLRGSPDLSLVSDEVKEKYLQAIAIIDSDDRGSWGANYAVHDKAIKEIFPEVKSAVDIYESKFKNFLRLYKFAEQKAAEAGDEVGSIKVLAFGHENMMAHALNEFFGNSQLKNCEVVGFESTDDGIKITYRGEGAEIK